MHRTIVGEECKILSGIRKASVLNFISFCRGRLSRTAIVTFLPELAPMLNFFGKQSILEWTVEMSKYNQTCNSKLEGGVGSPKIKHRFYSLDLFLLQVHPDKLAEVLESWVIFAERVAPLIRSDTDGRSWKLNRKLIIYRRHWFLLSRRIMNVVTTIGLLSGVDFRNQLHIRSPKRDMLSTAADRVARMYSGFALGGRCRFLPVGPCRK